MLFGDPALDVIKHPLRIGNLENISPPQKHKIKEIFGYFKSSLDAGWFGRFSREYARFPFSRTIERIEAFGISGSKGTD